MQYHLQTKLLTALKKAPARLIKSPLLGPIFAKMPKTDISIY